MFVKTFPVGIFQCNCVILGDEETGEALLVDPGDEAEKIMKELKERSWSVTHILHTHAHIDHIGATKALKNSTNGTLCLHKEDLFLYEQIKMQGEILGMSVDPEVKPIDNFIVHGDAIEWGKNLRAEVIHTPGHTPGSVSFLIKEAKGENFVLSGDTLFMGSIGRTDLWGGDFKQIIHSIKTNLMTLDESLKVIPGHGPQTTIGVEQKTNPFLT